SNLVKLLKTQNLQAKRTVVKEKVVSAVIELLRCGVGIFQDNISSGKSGQLIGVGKLQEVVVRLMEGGFNRPG
ncbi:MAG: hypothetical protein LC633_01560, partial [Desulfobulbaceae bacterium]|nr:hypothetical protein [Desulfobulbaceae bacterium]